MDTSLQGGDNMAAGNHITRRPLTTISMPDRTIIQIAEARIRKPGFGVERPNWQKYTLPQREVENNVVVG